jgi:hypothetical protein
LEALVRDGLEDFFDRASLVALPADRFGEDVLDLLLVLPADF